MSNSCDPMNCSTPGFPVSITNSWSSPKLMSTELVMPSSHLILCCPFSSCLQSFPTSGSFSGGQNIGVSASTSILPMNNQDWSPLGWTYWISSQSKRLSRVFSNNITGTNFNCYMYYVGAVFQHVLLLIFLLFFFYLYNMLTLKKWKY